MPIPNVADLVAATTRNRSAEIADNITNNNALLWQLKKKGRVRTVDGGTTITETIMYGPNKNAGWYLGYDTLPVGESQAVTLAEFPWRQAASPIIISGLEEFINRGKSKILPLIDARLEASEATMENLMAEGVYSDGFGWGGKQIQGLDFAVPVDPTTGNYGMIDRATNTFWRPTSYSPGVPPTADNVYFWVCKLYNKLTRGSDAPDLIIMGDNTYAAFEAKLQPQQRFTDSDIAKAGFTSYKFKGADVVLDGGQGGYANANTVYMLNTKYLSYRPHKDRDMVADTEGRYSLNQDAKVMHLFWMGNITCRNQSLQGRVTFTAP